MLSWLRTNLVLLILIIHHSPAVSELAYWTKFYESFASTNRSGGVSKVISLPSVGENAVGENFLDLILPLESENVHLRLRPRPFLTHRDFAYLIRTEDSNRVVEGDFHQSQQCFYVHDGNRVKASIDVCDGLNGIVLLDDDTYLIRALKSAKNISHETDSAPHVITKIYRNGKINNGKEEKRKTSGGRGKRHKRSFKDKDKVKVETAVFVDRDLFRHMMNNFPANTERNIFRFVTAMISAVQLLYQDASLEFDVSFILKRLEILHSDPAKLHRSHDIDRYLSSFCTWQEKENDPLKKSALHWDHALMLTGLDLYAIGKSGKFSSQVLGLAPVAGMCKPSSSCTVNEGLHFESVYVVAHEIGHNLGMRHDGPSADNDCDPNSHIMSPTLGGGKNTWSPCSNRYLAEFLRNSQARCLFETSDVKPDYFQEGTFPGELFDADQQCMLKYGKPSERSRTQNVEEICRDLRCTKERYTWTSHPALEGTQCGIDKWCRYGRCVEKSRLKTSGRVIDGGWSEWSPYSDCASACLLGNNDSQTGSTGIAISARSCNNPRPENGGNYCAGYQKRYRTCDALQCSNVPSTTVKEFAEQICRRAKEVDKDLIGTGFQRNGSDAEEACTVWCYLYNGGAKSRGWIFPDGTACHTGDSKSNPMFCVSGRCEEFHCSSSNDTEFLAANEHCQRSKFTQIKVSEPSWMPVGPCRYSCVTPAAGIRVLKRGTEYNIQLCQSTQNCNKKMTLFEYATNLCTKYMARVNKLSGIGVQLPASLEDPDRRCHVACQDEKYSHRFYLVTGEDGWFPYGSDCTRGNSGNAAYCISGKCLEFGKNNMPAERSELTFFNTRRRRRRSLELHNQTVTATIDLMAVRKFIDAANRGETILPHMGAPNIDFDNPIHISLEWQTENSALNFTDVT